MFWRTPYRWSVSHANDEVVALAADVVIARRQK
jgi:hypothetical protein